jgi:hypothetical protein
MVCMVYASDADVLSHDPLWLGSVHTKVSSPGSFHSKGRLTRLGMNLIVVPIQFTLPSTFSLPDIDMV